MQAPIEVELHTGQSAGLSNRVKVGSPYDLPITPYDERYAMLYVHLPKPELFAVSGFTLRRLSCTVGGRYLASVVPQGGT